MERAQLEAFLADGLSLEQIGALVDRDPSTVGYWLRKHRLKAVHSELHAARGGISQDVLEDLIAEGLTVRQIADRVDRSMGTVRHWLKRYGLRTQRHRRPRPPIGVKHGEAVCRHHGTTEFVRSAGRFRCVRCRSEAVARRRRRVKLMLVSEAGGRCEICGYDRTVAALHFHHRDPAEKRFQVSYGGATIAIDRLRSEVRKCALLCANCHAEVEAGFAELPPTQLQFGVAHDPG